MLRVEKRYRSEALSIPLLHLHPAGADIFTLSMPRVLAACSVILEGLQQVEIAEYLSHFLVAASSALASCEMPRIKNLFALRSLPRAPTAGLFSVCENLMGEDRRRVIASSKRP